MHFSSRIAALALGAALSVPGLASAQANASGNSVNAGPSRPVASDYASGAGKSGHGAGTGRAGHSSRSGQAGMSGNNTTQPGSTASPGTNGNAQGQAQ